MIDLHTHLLYDTDDGVINLKETINQIKEAKKVGIAKICLTPHYIEPNYIKTVEENEKKLENIKKELEKQNIDVEVFLGNEVFINGEVVRNIDEKNISTINNTSYVLVELPRHTEIKNIADLLERITDSGYSVIIAHPERYMCVQKNINYFYKLVDGPIYLQGNYESLNGRYGTGAKKTLIKLLKNKQIAILSTDIHRNNLYENIPGIIKNLKKIVSEEYLKQITEENLEKILNDEEIDVELKKIRKMLFI